MKAFWNWGSNFLVPVSVFMAALPYSGIDLTTAAPVVVMVAFMLIKILLQHVFFEPNRALFISGGREQDFLLYSMIVYSMAALATIQLFLLATHGVLATGAWPS